MTYPDGRTVVYSYDGYLDRVAGRPTAVGDAPAGGVGKPQAFQFDFTTSFPITSDPTSDPYDSWTPSSSYLERHTYLGLGTVVERERPDTGSKLTYVAQGTNDLTGDSGDAYVGLDIFNRIRDQRWVSGSGSGATDLDRYQYAYDRNSNPLGKKNTENVGLSEKYTYDELNRLSTFARGTASFSGSTVTLTGGTESQSWGLDALGNWDTFTTSNTSTGSTTQTRGHDRQNALTSVDGDDLAYDVNGNLTYDGTTGQSYVYDGWNRMGLADTGSVEKAYAYDALGRRVIAGDAATYYSKDWQALEEREIDNAGTTNAAAGNVLAQNVWSTVYVDALIARDEDTTGSTDGLGTTYTGSNAGGLERRLYFQNDASFNVTSLILDTGSSTDSAVERQTMSPYGVRTVRDASWVATSGNVSAYDNFYAHQGGKTDAVTSLVYFRFRDNDPGLGRWLAQDPLYWIDSVNRFELEISNPTVWLDPSGCDKIGKFFGTLIGGVIGVIGGEPPSPSCSRRGDCLRWGCWRWWSTAIRPTRRAMRWRATSSLATRTTGRWTVSSKRRKPKFQSLAHQEAFFRDPKLYRVAGYTSKEAGDNLRRLADEKERIGRITPSPAWAEDVYEHKAPFPPGGPQTAMRQCVGCVERGDATWYPPQYLTSAGYCCECVHDAMSEEQLWKLPPSASKVDYGRMRGRSMRRLVSRQGMDVVSPSAAEED